MTTVDDGCRESVTKRHDADRAGRCRWCRRKFERPVRMPSSVELPTELGDAYGYHWDPDWGTK